MYFVGFVGFGCCGHGTVGQVFHIACCWFCTSSCGDVGLLQPRHVAVSLISSIRSLVWCIVFTHHCHFLSSLAKWGPPGHTSWRRGSFSGARGQARAPPKTTHCHHCSACHFCILFIFVCNYSFPRALDTWSNIRCCASLNYSYCRASGAARCQVC